MVLGACSSAATKSRNSSVGMFLRLSLWRMDATLVGGFFALPFLRAMTAVSREGKRKDERHTGILTSLPVPLVLCLLQRIDNPCVRRSGGPPEAIGDWSKRPNHSPVC